MWDKFKNMPFWFGCGLIVLFVIFSVGYCQRAFSGFIPPVSDNQINIATLGHLTKDRYKDGFNIEAMLFKRNVMSSGRLVSVGYLRKNNGEDHGGLGGYFLLPVNYFQSDWLQNKLFMIMGGDVESDFKSYAGGGLMLDLDYLIVFAKQRGERTTRAGIVFPLFKRTMSFGLLGEHVNYSDIPLMESVWKAGISISFSLTDDPRRIRDDLMKQIEEAKRELEKIKNSNVTPTQ